MEKGRKRERVKLALNEEGFVLLFFDDSKYEILHSSSSLFTSDTKFSELYEKQRITLRQGFKAVVLMKSSNKSDLKVRRDRLEKKLDTAQIQMDDSFGFLNTSAVSAHPETDSDSDQSKSEEPSLMII